MDEVWKPIKNFDGYYVSNLGRVKSTKQNKEIILKNRTITPNKNNRYYLPYQQVVLYDNGKQNTKMIHRLVAECFLSNLDNKIQVHHIDNDVTNNELKNLEWVTASENVKYTLGYRKENRGVENNKSKLSEEDVLKIRKMYGENNITQRELAKLFNVSQPNIKEIVKFRTWKHL
jgi:hypothetical protein